MKLGNIAALAKWPINHNTIQGSSGNYTILMFQECLPTYTFQKIFGHLFLIKISDTLLKHSYRKFTATKHVLD